MHRLAVLAVISAASLLLSSCSAPPATVTGGAAVVTVTPDPVPPPWCAWYTPETGAALGQLVTVEITGPGCTTTTLIRWIAVQSQRPWGTTTGTPGTLIAQLSRAGTTVRIWQDGSALATSETAGGLADAFEAARWHPETATCAPLPFCGPPITPPESPPT
jgi:hypothetical protein